MGAFDCIYAPYQCLSCGAHHNGDWQSKFFDPDFFYRQGDSFLLRKPVRVLLSTDQLQHTILWEGSWLALTPWTPDKPLLLVTERYDWLYCSCGSQMIPCFYFSISQESGESMVTLLGVKCIDSSEVNQINFIDAEQLGNIEALATLPLEERRERFLQQINAEPFWMPSYIDKAAGATVAGPVRCNLCLEIRYRFLWCGYGATSPGVPIKVGEHRKEPLTFDEEGRMLSIREEPHDTLALLFEESWSCACSPNTKMFSLLCYSYEGAGLRLHSIELMLMTDEVLDRATHVAPALWQRDLSAFNKVQQWLAASPAERSSALRKKFIRE